MSETEQANHLEISTPVGSFKGSPQELVRTVSQLASVVLLGGVLWYGIVIDKPATLATIQQGWKEVDAAHQEKLGELDEAHQRRIIDITTSANQRIEETHKAAEQRYDGLLRQSREIIEIIKGRVDSQAATPTTAISRNDDPNKK